MTTCGKCGAENAAGDAFCGSCGAFLEFAAEEAAEVEGAAGAPAPEAVAAEAAAATPPIATTPAGAKPEPSATGAAGADAAAGGGSPGPDGPICGACGRANPAGRTFCISCGERLEDGRPAAGAGLEPGAREKPKPDWDFPTAPVPVVKPAAAAPGVVDDGGGRSRLPLVAGLLLVVGIVGGAAAFVAAGGLGGDGSAGATTSPSPTSGAIATPEPTPAATTPASTPEPTPTPGEPTAAPATVPPGPAVGLALTGAKASSRRAANADAKYLRDGSPASAWLSKAGAMADAWVEVTFDPAAVTRIQVWGGWQRDEPRYQGNHRPHNVTVAFDGGTPIPLELQDLLGAQRVDIPPELGIVGATRLRITIVDTYPATKTSAKGSPSKSVAISEIRLFGVPAAP
jgi:hypothetical protein